MSKDIEQRIQDALPRVAKWIGWTESPTFHGWWNGKSWGSNPDYFRGGNGMLEIIEKLRAENFVWQLGNCTRRKGSFYSIIIVCNNGENMWKDSALELPDAMILAVDKMLEDQK